MIHDFVLTERHIVLLACPVVFDLTAPGRGQSLLQWRPDLGTRIGVVGLDGGSVLWLDAEPFFVFHFANGFESGSRIVIDYVRHERLSLGSGHEDGKLPPMLHRMTIDLAGRRITDDRVADMAVEFPRANDLREATRTRFVYSATLTDTLGQSDPPSATFNAIIKTNAETRDAVRHDFGNRLVGEAVFVPRAAAAEDDGYLAVFVFDPANQTSDFVLLDAAHVDQEPVAVVRLPQRVPQGLHGSWIANG